MIKLIALAVIIIPYILTAIIMVDGIRKHKKKGKRILWCFPITIFCSIPFLTFLYIFALFAGSYNGMADCFMLCIIFTLALCFDMQPWEYNAGFDLAVVTIALGGILMVVVNGIWFVLKCLCRVTV